MTNDGTVDFLDFAGFAGMFSLGEEQYADFDRDGNVGLADLHLLYQFRLINALSIRSPTNRLNDSWIENSFVPSIDCSITKCIIIGINSVGPIMASQIMPKILNRIKLR